MTKKELEKRLRYLEATIDDLVQTMNAMGSVVRAAKAVCDPCAEPEDMDELRETIDAFNLLVAKEITSRGMVWAPGGSA